MITVFDAVTFLYAVLVIIFINVFFFHLMGVTILSKQIVIGC